MNKRPEVSVVIITYNHEKYIAQALDSVLMQKTAFKYEIIIGEDESDDKTRKIVLNYKNKYPDKITVLLNSRKDVIFIDGKPSGRHNFIKSLRKAEGKYISLLEGDDYWIDKNKLQKQYDFLENNSDYAICSHTAEFVDESGKSLKRYWKPPLEKEYYTKEDLFLYCNFIATASVMFVNNLFEDFPEWFKNFKVGDWPLHILNASYGKIKFMDEVMSAYRIHPGGIASMTDMIKQFQSRLVMYELFKKNSEKKYYPFINKAMSLIYYNIACEYEDVDNKKMAIKYVFKDIFKFYDEKKVFLLKIKLLLRVNFPTIYKMLKKKLKRQI